MARKWYVLVVDDDPFIRLALKYNLDRDGFEVAVVGTADEALASAAQRKPDLILLDWNMPEKDGLETLREIREDVALKDIHVFMLTCHRLIGDIEDAFSLGADGYLAKPFDPQVLSSRLRTRLEAMNPPHDSAVEAFSKSKEVVSVTVKRRLVTDGWA